MSEIEQTQQQARKQKLKPTKATVQTAPADAVDDLDWIQLDNGWQLVICDEEAWAEMGLTPAGFSRIIDRLQAATTGQPPGNVTLSQGELEAALTNQAVCWPQDSPQDPSKISLHSSRDRRSSS